MDNKFKRFEDKLFTENASPLLIDTFHYYYDLLVKGDRGVILEKDIDPVPVNSLPLYDALASFVPAGESALSQVAIVKFNGGLGTSMGLDGPKCLLPAKPGYSFFDITIQQIRELNKRFATKIPLILMNSFWTDTVTNSLLSKHHDIKTAIPQTFVQNKYPKILKDTLEPASWPADRVFEWNPPGHGDIYTSLISTGILRNLLDYGIRYIFISNIDNLGATLDTALLGYFSTHNLPYMMEVVERSEMDKKGGHLACLKNGRLILRERAQTLPEEYPFFEDIDRYHYFNSNNMWVNLDALKALTDSVQHIIKLPLIANEKNLIPHDKTSPKIYQIETAAGCAISLFSNARAVVISDTRFMPVKKCENLAVLWSDNFFLTDSYEMIKNPSRHGGQMLIALDDAYYGKFGDLKKRFPGGAPSLVNCDSLTVKGDVVFGKNIVVLGSVTIVNKSGRQVTIADNTVIDKDLVFDKQ
jgi:UTP--glucose-1-phosphate uridylyltransferase